MKPHVLILASLSLAGGLAAPASSQDFEANAQAQGVIENIVNGLIGNRYNVRQREAVRTCAWASVRKAERDYRRYFNGRPSAYPGYRGYVRVTAITDVQQRALVTRVRGLLDTSRYGYRGGRHGADLSFRCDVNGRGQVSDVRLERNVWFQPR